MRVLFINPPKFNAPRRDVGALLLSPNIGVASLAACLRRQNHVVEVIDAIAERIDMRAVGARAIAFKPDIIGLSSMTDRIHDHAESASELKTILPGVLTIVGGAHPSALPSDTIVEFPSFDFAAHGEGEETMSELLAALSSGGDLSTVDGLAWKSENDAIVNPPRIRIHDLDALPFPAFDLFPLNRYQAFYTRDPNVRELPVSTARGCPYRCVFCSKVMGEQLFVRSIRNVIDEIQSNHRDFGATQFVMTDESFTVDIRRASEFCDMFIAESLHKQINWIVHSRVDITKDIIIRMRQANCTHITFGIESGNQRILDLNDKKITLEKTIDAIRWSREAGVTTDGNIILGLPYEDESTIRDTVRFALKCNPHYVSFFLLVPYPGSRVMELAQAGEANLRLLSTDWRYYGKQVGGAVELKTVSRRKLERIQFLAYLRFYLRPGKIRLLFKKIDLLTVFRYMASLRKSSASA